GLLRQPHPWLRRINGPTSRTSTLSADPRHGHHEPGGRDVESRCDPPRRRRMHARWLIPVVAVGLSVVLALAGSATADSPGGNPPSGRRDRLGWTAGVG